MDRSIAEIIQDTQALHRDIRELFRKSVVLSKAIKDHNAQVKAEVEKARKS